LKSALLKNELPESSKGREEVYKTTEQFLTNICHEIRTPMHIILGLGKQLSKSNFSSKKKALLQAIITTAENLLFTINDTLDLAKIDAGTVEIVQKSFQMDKVMIQLKKILGYKAAEKGLSFTIQFSDSIHPVLIGDPFRLNQVLINLAWNAFKFTDKGFVKISCRVLSDNQNNQLLEFQVKDSGIGINKEQLDKVFVNFYQGDTDVARAKGGTGLGLTISRQIVELLGGSLKVYSKKNIGTRFSFTLPMKKGLENELPVKREIVSNKSLLKGKQILIADDNELSRQLVTIILQQYGASVSEAVSGEEVIHILQHQPVHLVLMDVQMPLGSGLEISRFVREELKSNVPIIALTSNTFKPDLEKCIEYGMTDYLTKPFNEEDLIEKIGKSLHVDVKWKNSKQLIESGYSHSRYSTHKLKAIGRGDGRFVKKMLSSFAMHVSASIEEMRLAYLKKDFHAISKIIHRIKPDIDCLEIVELKGTVRELEKIAKRGHDKQRIRELVDIVSETMKVIIQDIYLNHLNKKEPLQLVKKIKLDNSNIPVHLAKSILLT